MASIFDDLPRALSGADVLLDPAVVAPYGNDHLGARGAPGAVVRPRSTEDVSRLLALAVERGFSVVARAAATNLCGAFVPDERSVVLDMTGMDRIIDIDPDGRRAVVEPGIINGALQEALRPHGLCFSPDPASRLISTVGGNIACNAGGPGCIKYGVTFHHIHAVEVVLPGGRVIELTDSDPVDLLGLVIGSEGTLGVVTRATVRLRPLPTATWTALASFEHLEHAAEAVSAVIAARAAPSALELMDRRSVEVVDSYAPTGYPTDPEAVLFVEADGEPHEVQGEIPRLLETLRKADPGLRVATSPDERAQMWAGRLAFGLAKVALGKENFVNDMSVPRQRIPEMIMRVRAIAATRGLDVPVVAHAGDGNVHPSVLYDEHDKAAVAGAVFEMSEAALELGGTITGEHGVGIDKIPHMTHQFSPAEIASFRAIKRAFDPLGALNPHVMLPPESDSEPDARAFERLVARALAGDVLEQAQVHEPKRSDFTIDEENLTVDVGAAAMAREVGAALKERGLSCGALDSSRTVGEAISNGEAHTHLRASLLGITATTQHGPVRFGGAAIKDVAGLDAKRLFVGTGDAFGTVERATFRVAPTR